MKQIALDILVPMRHVEWGGNMGNSYIAAYGYGTLITQPCLYHAMDHLGVAAVMALFQLGRHLIWLLIAVLVLQAVTGWTNPGSMAFRLFSLMCEALCRPFRRFIKPT